MKNIIGDIAVVLFLVNVFIAMLFASLENLYAFIPLFLSIISLTVALFCNGLSWQDNDVGGP